MYKLICDFIDSLFYYHLNKLYNMYNVKNINILFKYNINVCNDKITMVFLIGQITLKVIFFTACIIEIDC